MSFARTIAITAATGAIMLAVAACDDSSGTSGSYGTTDAANEVEVPTVEEADAAAAREITAENADEAFEELSAEIDAELEEDGG